MSEFDHGPLLPHETGFGSAISDGSDSAIYSDLAPKFPHEDEDISDDGDGGLDDAPLLPHERSSSTGKIAGSDFASGSGFLPAIAYQPPRSSFPIFARRISSRIWKSRSNSSSLPHSLPRSDAEDENLHDPSLEAFPTQRERIFERVATISTHLPEDESGQSHSGVNSPEVSVMSQACSSIDLAPIGSHTSLHRIAEDALMETEEDSDSALGSPVMELSFRTGTGTSSEAPALKAEAGSESKTPMSQEKGGEYSKEGKNQQESDETELKTRDDSEDASMNLGVQKNDGAGDNAPATSRRWTPDAIARPASALDPILTAPFTPSERTPAKANDRIAVANKGSPKVKFTESASRGGHENAPAAHRPNIFVRAWRKLKHNTA